jgi:phosphoribosylglycinamide formyltransferase 2
MSSSGKGQSRITQASEIKAAWDYAASGGRVNQGVVIVEGQIDFDYEITLLTVRAKNSQGEIQTYFCEPIGHRQERGDYVESWQPQPMTAASLKAAQMVAKSITDALGGLGLFGVELFVKGDQVWFSEVSPRPHDTGMVTMCSQRLSEFELHARAILGLPVDVSLTCSGASAVIYGGHDSDSLSFSGLEAALEVPNSDVRLFGKPTSFVRRRMGVALATGKDIQEARDSAQKVVNCIQTKGH